MAHSTDPPMELLQDQEMLKKRKAASPNVASAILNAVSHNNPEVDTKRELPDSMLHSLAVFAMRGFGKFERALGIGGFSDQLEDALIRTADIRRELRLNRGWRFPTTARFPRDATKRPTDACSSKYVQEATDTMGDFYRTPMGRREVVLAPKGNSRRGAMNLTPSHYSRGIPRFR